jgi:hypothetical protein
MRTFKLAQNRVECKVCSLGQFLEEEEELFSGLRRQGSMLRISVRKFRGEVR